MLTYSEAQSRCTEQMHSLTQEMDALKRQLLQMRARLVLRDSQLDWEREQRHTLALAMAWEMGRNRAAIAEAAADEHPMPAQLLSEQQLLEDSLHAADLVICQTGCISDGAYWRVKDHCKRTGKTCLLVDQPTALRVVRIHPSSEDGKVLAAKGCIEGAL